ncbi:MAG: hypothetical protein Q9191_001860 [Dirinaria sp. TL-2023a]
MRRSVENAEHIGKISSPSDASAISNGWVYKACSHHVLVSPTATSNVVGVPSGTVVRAWLQWMMRMTSHILLTTIRARLYGTDALRHTFPPLQSTIPSSSMAFLNCAEDVARSFSHVIQDNQFAALGLVLFAELAKISRLVGAKIDNHQDAGEPTIDPQKALQAPVLRLFEDFGEAVERKNSTETLTHLLRGSVERSDLGRGLHSTPTPENTEKHPFCVQPTRSVAMQSGKTSVNAHDTPPKRPKKRKRKGTNAIDDLFQALE